MVTADGLRVGDQVAEKRRALGIKSPEVKELAPVLAESFKSKDIHREALAALRLFHEAAEREAATADFARRVLSFLFRARYDEGLKFGPVE